MTRENAQDTVLAGEGGAGAKLQIQYKLSLLEHVKTNTHSGETALRN